MVEWDQVDQTISFIDPDDAARDSKGALCHLDGRREIWALLSVGPWEEILKTPLLWHFRFRGPDMERLVADGRQASGRSRMAC